MRERETVRERQHLGVDVDVRASQDEQVRDVAPNQEPPRAVRMQPHHPRHPLCFHLPIIERESDFRERERVTLLMERVALLLEKVT